MFTSLTASSDRIKAEEAADEVEAEAEEAESDVFHAEIGGGEAPAHASKKKRISSFQALMVSTASRVGTGNIVGIATAIAMGGPGAVFWMWCMAIIGSASAFIESTLAQIWKVKNGDGTFRGGPAYYIQQALGKRWLGVVFAIALILCFAFGFNGLQTFNITSALDYYVIPEHQFTVNALVGLLIVIATALVIFGGMHRISVITSVIVPIMAGGYILVAVWTTVSNLGELPAILQLIFTEAFNPASFAGGFTGSCLMWGIKRGLFSNEAGMGSAPNAAATADVSHPCKQGLVQSLSVYIDTLLICTCSAFMMMVFYVQDPELATTLNGMAFVQMAMNNSIGEIGIHMITAAIFVFGFSSLIGNYFYAEGNIKFIKDNKTVLFWFRILCLCFIMYGAVNSFDLAWNLSDIFMGFMAIINLISIILLGKYALQALDDYSKQRKAGLNPIFHADSIPGLPPTECWHEEDVLAFGGTVDGKARAEAVVIDE
ncbi:MAG: alanine:cation symporter family protein [Eggerthellaceae bacterium]|nr:alanine:cation symporter family protein [Eggerthellaceae bacterium]